MNKPSTYKEDSTSKFIFQRNILMVFSFICVIVIGICIFSIMKLSISRKIDAFVVQIDNETGITKIVNPIDIKELSANDEIAKYFIRKYIIAREAYNPSDFDNWTRLSIKLMSTNFIYKQYIGYIFNEDNNPKKIYGEENSTYIKIKSWSKVDKKYIVRFSIHENIGNMNVQHKIAIVDIDYVSMELTQEQREINPIGFQIKGYNVNDDNS